MNLAVIFDMDGVLVNTVGLAWQSYNRILADYGVHVPTKDIHEYVGMALPNQVKLLGEKFDVKIDAARFQSQAMALKIALFANVSSMPGAQELLEKLKAANVPMAVGTSTDRGLTETLLKRVRLDGYFDAVVTHDDVTAHKPEPDVYVEGARRLGAQAAKCVVVEDAPAGIKAAHNAQMKCVGVVTEFATREQLGKADLVVESLKDIAPDKLRELL